MKTETVYKDIRYTLSNENLEVGDYVYGNQSLTIPPVDANFTISNGGRFIQLSGNQIINVGVC